MRVKITNRTFTNQKYLTMSESLIKTVEDLNKAVIELRLSHEKKDNEAVAKIEAALNAYEEKNQALVANLAAKDNQIKEIEQKLISLTSVANYSNDNEVKNEIKSYEDFLAKGFYQTEKKYLRTDSFVAGGVFVPTPQLSGIIKNIVEISNLRSFAKVRTMGAKAETMAVRTGTASAFMTGEGQASIDTQAKYGDIRLEAKKMTAEYSISYEQIQDSETVVDLIAEMNAEIGEQFALLEGSQFVNGSGAGNNILGFMQHPDISSINSGDASNITFDSLIKVTGEIKTGYRPIYAFNRKTLAALRLLKDPTNRYIWESGNLGVDMPSNINGVPYIILPDMPDIAANTFPIIYGDFSKIMIGDRKAITVVRDEATLATTNLIRFVFHRRVGMVVTNPEAFKKIKISNS